MLLSCCDIRRMDHTAHRRNPPALLFGEHDVGAVGRLLLLLLLRYRQRRSETCLHGTYFVRPVGVCVVDDERARARADCAWAGAAAAAGGMGCG